jgi:hypothetical protein
MRTLQVQGIASGAGTVIGTCIRIPCEVLKQRLQVGCLALLVLLLTWVCRLCDMYSTSHDVSSCSDAIVSRTGVALLLTG